MSALELIFAYLIQGEAGASEGFKKSIEPTVRREAQTLYDAVAHELAEKIRTAVRDYGVDDAYTRGGSHAADLIDPQEEGQ